MTSRIVRPLERAPLPTERRVLPLPSRRRAGRPPAAGWLAPVFVLRPMPCPSTDRGTAA